MRIIIGILTISFLINFSKCESINNYRKIIVDEDVKLINTINDNTYKIVLHTKRRKEDLVSMIDTIIVDTVNVEFINFYDLYLSRDNMNLYLCYQDYDKIKIDVYNLLSGSIRLSQAFSGEYIGIAQQNIFFGINEKLNIKITKYQEEIPINSPIRTLQRINILTNVTDTLLYLKYGEDIYLGITEVVCFHESYVIQYCVKNSDSSLENCKYFLFNHKTNEITLIIPSEKFKYHDLRNHRKIEGDLAIVGNIIFDSSLQFIGNAIEKDISKIGYYDTDDYKGIYVRSTTDKKIGAYSYESAIIVINETAAFELAMYDIVNNKEITNDLISGLSLDNLDLLKKSVWAKHNFAFVDLYEQAYFNLYYFYNNGKDSRKTRVEHKFTGTDKANLKLIEEVIKEKGGR